METNKNNQKKPNIASKLVKIAKDFLLLKDDYTFYDAIENAECRVSDLLEEVQDPVSLCERLNFEDDEFKEDIIALWILSKGTFIDRKFKRPKRVLLERDFNYDFSDAIFKVPFLYIEENHKLYKVFKNFDTNSLKEYYSKIVLNSFDSQSLDIISKELNIDFSSLKKYLKNNNLKLSSIELIFDDSGNFSNFNVKFFEPFKDFDIIEKCVCV